MSRPALVVGSDAGNTNERYPLAIVAAISTARRNILTHVSLEPNEENGLREPSSVKCEQLLTFSKERLLTRIGRIDDSSLRSVESAIKLALTLP